MTNRDERRSMLLDMAAVVILRFGYRKTTLEDIAAEAGVSRATVYNYFPSKEEVFRAIIDREMERYREVSQAAIPTLGLPDERLLAYVRAQYQQLRRLKAVYGLRQDVARDVLNFAVAEIDAFQVEERAFLAAILQEGVDSGRFGPLDAASFAVALQAALRGLQEDFMFSPATMVDEQPPPDSAMLERSGLELLEVLCRGLIAIDGGSR
jgi:AcrR family transcriptional regulator